MAWIKTVGDDEATGLLKSLYQQAVKRAGKVFNVVRIQGLHPRALRASILLYRELMHGADNRLKRYQREMIATATSRANDCFY